MLDEPTRRNVCRLIAGLVVIDNELDDTEDAFINNMLTRFGLSPEERDVLFPIVDAKEAAQELTKLPPAVQNEVFGLLVEATAADKRFVDEEREYLNTVGKVLGLSAEEIQRRVTVAIGGGG